MLPSLRDILREYQPRRRDEDLPEAGVLLLLTEDPEPHLVLTRRAAHMRSHAGEVACPGGRREPADASIVATALRETHEEIGLDPERVEVAGVLSQSVSRFGLKVTPVVGVIPADIEFAIDQRELESLFKVPVSFLCIDQRVWSLHYQINGQNYYTPAWQWQDYLIWGLTAILLVELVNVCFGATISLHEKPAGEIRIRP